MKPITVICNDGTITGKYDDAEKSICMKTTKEYRTDADEFIKFQFLKKLSNYFGTTSITWDGYDTWGCKTCGYGGLHTREITVLRITREDIHDVVDLREEV